MLLSQDSEQTDQAEFFCLRSKKLVSKLCLAFPLLSAPEDSRTSKKATHFPAFGKKVHGHLQGSRDLTLLSSGGDVCRLGSHLGPVVKVAEALLEPHGAGENHIYQNFSQEAFCKPLEGMSCYESSSVYGGSRAGGRLGNEIPKGPA